MEAWALSHLAVCQQLLQDGVRAPNKDTGVREIVLGGLLRELGALLGPGAFFFRVNTFYLPDYYATWDRLKGTPGEKV